MSEQTATLEAVTATTIPLLDTAASVAGRIADYAANQTPSSLVEGLKLLTPSLSNPAHVLLLGVAGYFGFRIVMSATTASKPERFSMSSISSKKVPAKRDFTPHELAECNGKDEDTPLYIGVKGIVYDVSQSRGFYGPGGPYSNFSGRDASRGLALACFEESVLTGLDDPIDNLEDLDQAERDSLDEWAEFFAGKYVPVGRLVAPKAEEKKSEKSKSEKSEETETKAEKAE
ncbi:Dihydrodipicolinate synthase [Coemansia sp. RSA 1813]|nr:Dihydrodipicolinate synthase [Coemansia sp. RSA 1646]KAJ1768461.1 Dihydrodipicolinate synthase [Coemansia sp. RSA 1843]KAJ2087924.1 Dihydrodipicolinate synthase [Coemansia sp. RSA 986]KAJ2212881.1 Dihydrodipicolinate synthase [Coemansia sp. RSA 487]KAJ2567650.1 Dihydrodipicolinate synthase [Coemansia sp. RSA 1813]